MGVKPGVNKNASKNTQTSTKYATSQECETCDAKCPKGKAHLKKLAAKHQSSCPVCNKKK